eukprot:14233-Pelagococcus_subviridis.AAC.4
MRPPIPPPPSDDDDFFGLPFSTTLLATLLLPPDRVACSYALSASAVPCGIGGASSTTGASATSGASAGASNAASSAVAAVKAADSSAVASAAAKTSTASSSASATAPEDSAIDVGIAMSAPSAFFAFLESASSSLDARAIATRFLGAAARRPPRTAALGARAIVDDDDVEDNAIMVTAAARAVSRGRREARCDWRARCARCASTEGASVGGWTEACRRWRARIGYRRRFHDRLTAFHDSSCGAELSSTSTDRHWTYFRTTYIFETRQTFAHTNSLFDTFSRPGRYYFC